METPKTLQQAIIYFAKPENCNQFMIAARWADGKVRCPSCDSDKVTYLENAKVWKCYSKHPRPKFSLKVGTIFEDSPLSLSTWLSAMWLIANAKNGISSYEIHRALGITQKSAWFVLHRIRLAMQNGSIIKLKGTVEADETFVGGKAAFMHKGKRKAQGPGSSGKVPVVGTMERGGEVRATVVNNTRIGALQPFVRENVEAGSTLYTDWHGSYVGMPEYKHGRINHAKTYIDGDCHTNSMENFWSLLKRAIKGTYVSVEPFHLFRYVDEQAFRFNTRKGNDADRFDQLLQQVTGKRIQYKQLTSKAAH
jgi:transposase-like protein